MSWLWIGVVASDALFVGLVMAGGCVRRAAEADVDGMREMLASLRVYSPPTTAERSSPSSDLEVGG